MTERRFYDEAWDSDEWFQCLNRDQRYLFIYLWTNRHVNQACCYYITLHTIAFEAKFDKEEIPSLINSLAPKVKWLPEENLIWVKNFIKRQSKSPKFLIAVANCLKSLNNNGVAREVVAYNLEHNRVSIPYQYDIDRVSILTRVSPSTSLTQSKSKEKGVVKGEEEIPPSESEIEESLSAGDPEVISVWRSVKGFSMPNEEAVELVARLRTEFPNVDILDESKAWAARKFSEPLKPSSRPSSQVWNWMRKAREFARERRKDEQQSRKPKQERKRPITYIRGSEPVGSEDREDLP